MNYQKSCAKFGNITVVAWSSGVQIQVGNNPNKTFVSKCSIGALHLIKDTNGSYIRYTPMNFQNCGPYNLASWHSEKVSNDFAIAAYEFIMEVLYDKPNDERDSNSMANSQLYI